MSQLTIVNVIAEHIPISVGYIWQGNFKYYFGLDCIKRFASALLEIETENIFKRNKQMIFNNKINCIIMLQTLFKYVVKHVLIK